MKVSDYIHTLNKTGQHFFTLKDAIATTQKSRTAVLAALSRLQKKGKIALPYRGFYLIIPPEYETSGCLTPDLFIPDLMQYIEQKYYVGLLSAGQYYGAAHQKPQVFQVVTDRYRKPIICGAFKTVFIKNKNIDKIPVRKVKTKTGFINVSSPEATAIDLVKFQLQSAGINNVTTVLMELSESINIDVLEKTVLAINPEVVILQRLGYLFDLIGEKKISEVIFKLLTRHKLRARPLVAGISTKNKVRDKKWDLYINYKVEADL